MTEEARHRALARGLRILEAVADGRGGLTVTELAELTGTDKSSVSRLVATLVDLGFLARLGNRRVVLTGRVLSLAKGFQKQYNLSEIARPYLKELCDVVGETVILTIRQGDYTVSIEQIDPEQPFRMVPHIGNLAPLHATAAGRAILFALPVVEQHRILDNLRDAPVEHPEVRLDRESWARELELARSRGYVWIPRTDDVERVAALAQDRNGLPLAAVSVYGPKYRMQSRVTELGREARATAAKMSRAAYGIRAREHGQ
ncbi:DNA-binding IclR family transcriptional regulator [Streptosporangium album]|uniref:DNA-binding IclR family transcriptional regulator n=1 Tax=Streptosporangium album TaxID=47479 RepID=A0A7W7S4I8_9ACTN|nr:IclR family transcriptional regulator [Streptosporangium album]MBB4943372.1 DNA-binding IclR family transcriptional regulator [Streptosporangium album]